MASAVAKLSRMVHISRVAMPQLRRAKVNIDGGDTRVDKNIFDPCFRHANFRLGMPEVKKASRGTHWPERRSGDDIDFFRRRRESLLVNVVDNFFRSQNNSLARLNAIVDLFVCFHDSFGSINRTLYSPDSLHQMKGFSICLQDDLVNPHFQPQSPPINQVIFSYNPLSIA
jgi:hypothetical protein